MSKKKTVTVKLGDGFLSTLFGLPLLLLTWIMVTGVYLMIALAILSPLIFIGLLVWWIA